MDFPETLDQICGTGRKPKIRVERAKQEQLQKTCRKEARAKRTAPKNILRNPPPKGKRVKEPEHGSIDAACSETKFPPPDQTRTRPFTAAPTPMTARHEQFEDKICQNFARGRSAPGHRSAAKRSRTPDTILFSYSSSAHLPFLLLFFFSYTHTHTHFPF